MKNAALMTAVAGGALSVFLMIHTGRYEMPPINIALIGLWVLMPYDVMVIGNVLSSRWPAPGTAAIHRMTFLITTASVLVYAYAAFGPPVAKPAFFFVLVPPVAMAVMGLVVWAAAMQSRQNR